ncbi:hypothetical protein NEIFLAOT_01609 [Neisseria flavescens NRL30031/H210]|uniref:Uncharacterized protein n=1 Tax=Neisseria flavescens NRL30031/H210 TaxID=546264 RepID=C0ENS2_NEIFL|nr:hypothetical protein NEIFLAOT_01609 [Neisseria flavescens NRL30031/H210]
MLFTFFKCLNSKLSQDQKPCDNLLYIEILIIDALFDNLQIRIRQNNVVLTAIFKSLNLQHRLTSTAIGINFVNLIAALFQHSYGFSTVLLEVFVAVDFVFDVIAGTGSSGRQSNDGGQ